MQQFVLHLWVERTLCQIVPQEQQGECSIQATSQLYRVMPDPAKLYWARASSLSR